jgi:CBS domain-containing protein
MKTARDIMTPGADWIDLDLTVVEAARRMADGGMGAMPVCNGDGHLQGMITDRDIVVKVLAAGKDPKSTKVGELADQPEVVTIGADDSIDEALATMKKHAVRRLPVIDGTDLVGMVSQADVARNLDEDKVGDLVDAISSAPDNN